MPVTGSPHAVVSDTKPAVFAVRDAFPGVDRDALTQPGQGMALWMHATEVQTIHDALLASSAPIIVSPMNGPLGLTFTDPDEYEVASPDRAWAAARDQQREL